MEIPRSCSISIQSEVASFPLFLAPTIPAVRTIPEYKRSFSVKVVFPASGWLIMAKVRRLAAADRISCLTWVGNPLLMVQLAILFLEVFQSSLRPGEINSGSIIPKQGLNDIVPGLRHPGLCIRHLKVGRDTDRKPFPG